MSQLELIYQINDSSYEVRITHKKNKEDTKPIFLIKKPMLNDKIRKENK
jgi:hypothetical protein